MARIVSMHLHADSSVFSFVDRHFIVVFYLLTPGVAGQCRLWLLAKL